VSRRRFAYGFDTSRKAFAYGWDRLLANAQRSHDEQKEVVRKLIAAQEAGRRDCDRMIREMYAL